MTTGAFPLHAVKMARPVAFEKLATQLVLGRGDRRHKHHLCGGGTIYTTVADKGLYEMTIPGVRGLLHAGATKNSIKRMLDLKPVNDSL